MAKDGFRWLLFAGRALDGWRLEMAMDGYG